MTRMGGSSHSIAGAGLMQGLVDFDVWVGAARSAPREGDELPAGVRFAALEDIDVAVVRADAKIALGISVPAVENIGDRDGAFAQREADRAFMGGLPGTGLDLD